MRTGRRWTQSIGLLPAAVLALAAGAVQPAATQARSSPRPSDAFEDFLRPRMAVLPGGRRIALHCAGRGSPTVVLTAGAGDWADTWRKVVSPLARHARVCGWDRAGFGFSDASREPQDVVHTEHDLEQALGSGGVAGPYVLVSHSMGAYETLLFADRHPGQVKAMVLVDPSFPDMDRVVRAHRPAAAAFLDRQTADQLAADRRCDRALRRRTLSAHVDPDHCLAVPVGLPADVTARLKTLARDPDRARTRTSFDESVARDTELVINPRRSYAATPLLVLTAANDLPLPSDWPPAVADFLHNDWIAAHDALAALSSRGSNRVVPRTSHYIQLQQPAAVTRAVETVLGSGPISR